MNNKFHLAIPVTDLQQARDYYREVLGLKEKRSAFNWVDFDFFGHQLSLNLVKEKNSKGESTIIDGDQVPAMHFGLVVAKDDWEKFKEQLSSKSVKFLIGPKVRFKDKPEEQGTFFISDPSGNFIEIKYFSGKMCEEWI